jgi:hypothetical protein
MDPVIAIQGKLSNLKKKMDEILRSSNRELV